MTELVTKEQENKESLKKAAQFIEQVDISKLPTIIEEQIEQIKVLDGKIKDALTASKEAENVANGAKPVKLFHKKAAIEELQKSGKKTAEALGETVDALKLSFEYEKQLGEISKILLAIAACSAAHTEKSIKEINDAIQNRASGKALSNTAKERLQEIVDQIKIQGENIKRMEEQDRQIREMAEDDARQDRQISEMAEDDDRQDALIEELQKKLQRLEKWKIVTLVISCFALTMSLLQIIGIV